MNKFTLPTLEERIEYKKQEDEKLKKRIEESVKKLDKELKEAKERLDRVAIGFGFSPSYFSKENIEKRERKKELERIQIRKEIEQELRKEYEKKYKLSIEKYKSSNYRSSITIGESKIESLSLFSYKGSPITRHSGGSLPMMSPLYEPTSCYPSNNYDCCKLFDEMVKNPNYAHWLVQVGNPSCSDGPSWECGSLGNY